MKKEEIIGRYGEEEYNRRLAHKRAYCKEHKEEESARKKKYRKDNPEKVKADAHMHGFVDVIEILDGKIALLTEEEIKNRK